MENVIKHFEEIVSKEMGDIDIDNLWDREFDDKFYLNIFQFMKIVSACEKEFEIEFSDDALDIDGYKSLEEIKDTVLIMLQNHN